MAKPFARQLYNTKAWRNARSQALRRDSYTCQICGGHATEVHHKISLDESNINDPKIALGLDNLQSICWWCHNKETMGVSDISDGYCFDENGQVIKI